VKLLTFLIYKLSGDCGKKKVGLIYLPENEPRVKKAAPAHSGQISSKTELVGNV
jgi:hypothetical protein